MELEEKSKQFAVRGLNLAVITYDTVAVLKHFADRKGIHYPLLSDEGSKVIREFGILNETIAPENQFYGVPFPGTYVVDEKGMVKSKHFEADYRERFTGGGILTRDFGEEGAHGQSTETKHLKLRVTASNSVVYPGHKVTLILEAAMKPGMHVYAPGAGGEFIPVDWKIQESPMWRAFDPDYPKSRELKNKFRLARDLTMGQARVLGSALADGKIKLDGTFRYQACKNKVCYPPETVPLTWTFDLRKLDSERAPKELRGPSKL